MRNLAGDEGCDVFIKNELEKAEIDIIYLFKPLRNEVPASITGKLGKFTFVRAWYYWMVSGEKVPFEVAKEMYKNPNGRKDVRVEGYAGNISPSGDVSSYHIDS